ncbi:MAG: L-seryl-tRNA(Sec) selenium transferase, partial [Armatimonadota bacterium]
MSEHLRQQLVRSLPAVDKLLNTPPLLELEAQQVPRNALVMAAREVIDELRSQILTSAMPSEDELRLERIAEMARKRALLLISSSLRRVVNATGIILHTGLGRAVLPETARKALELVASGHSNVELDLETGGRGSRDAHFSGLLAALCGAESAIAVNNNAAAVMLALNTLAAGREVIVSRGQLIEIGGSFRLPEIMARAGVRLVEVGTTNHTRLSDYEAAITDETALLLRVHTSNYRILGFASEVPLKDLAELGRRYDIPVMEDAGSGSLIDLTSFGLHGEPLIQDSVKAGANIVTFSGDKLLGGPQCGLIVGCREMVEAMARN